MGREGIEMIDELAGAAASKNNPWPGITSDKVYDYIINGPGGPRVAMGAASDKQKGHLAGIPDMASTRFAVRDPRLRLAGKGELGSAFMEMTPGELEGGRHLTYDTHLPGTYLGSTEQQFPVELLLPNLAAEKNAKRSDPIRSYMMSPGHEVVGDEQIDALARLLGL
jgi:hypothetical protein